MKFIDVINLIAVFASLRPISADIYLRATTSFNPDCSAATGIDADRAPLLSRGKFF
jgi:hypothetical protein